MKFLTRSSPLGLMFLNKAHVGERGNCLRANLHKLKSLNSQTFICLYYTVPCRLDQYVCVGPR
jgi:hypothetical protein